MRDPSRLNDQEMARQAQQHLAGLQAAGVEWLPKGALLERLPKAEEPSEPAAEPVASSSLFPNPAADKEKDPHPLEKAAAGMTLEQRRIALQVLKERVAGCMRCPELASTRSKTVFGAGNPGVELCFIGEAPGHDEDVSGEPFVGPAGQLLNRIITACRMKREDVYICNIVKCRPPSNRLPLANEAANCRGYLEEQLELVRPKFICCLGSCAAQNLLSTTASVGRLRGRLHDFRGIPVLVTYHPAYLLRYPDQKKEVWKDMKLLMARMGRPVE